MFHLLCAAASLLNPQTQAVMEMRPKAGAVSWGLGPAFWYRHDAQTQTGRL